MSHKRLYSGVLQKDDRSIVVYLSSYRVQITSIETPQQEFSLIKPRECAGVNRSAARNRIEIAKMKWLQLKYDWDLHPKSGEQSKKEMVLVDAVKRDRDVRYRYGPTTATHLAVINIEQG